MSAFARFWRGTEGERGQALVLIAITFLGMLMAVGLAIDSGQLFVARRTAQEAADAGAYAGAVYIYLAGNTDTATVTAAQLAATNDVQRNGYTNNGDGGRQSVSVTQPAGYDAHYVEVDITVQVPTSLVPAQSGLTTVSVHAIAGAVGLQNGYAIMALNRGNTASALYVASNGHVNVQYAGILVNSTASNAANNNGGTVSITSSPTGTVVAGGTAGTWPSPTTGATPQADPFAGYPKPSTQGLAVFDAGHPIPTPVGSAVTLSPGLYKVVISYAGNVTATFLPGTYILEAGMNGSGNMDFQNTSTTGIFIFNTLTNYPASGAGDTCGGVNISGNANTQLWPETSGPYQGLLFYQDPACTQPFTISGNGTLDVHGSVYVPKGQVVLNGNNATLEGSQIVADTVSVQNGTVQVNFSSGSTAKPVLPRLVK